MKKYITFSTLLTLMAVNQVNGAVSFNLIFDQLNDSSGSAVAAGTLWALVSDGGNDGFGGFGLNESLNSSASAGSIFTPGQTINIGSTFGAGNTVFAMGSNLQSGVITNVLNIDYGSNGVAENVNFALYWFPGATFSGGVGQHTFTSSSQTIGSQVGGIHNSSDDINTIFQRGMSFPADAGGSYDVGAGSQSAGASTSDSRFIAVNLIPEPSAALLGAFGALAMLRRRREA